MEQTQPEALNMNGDKGRNSAEGRGTNLLSNRAKNIET
jgi:hypothetical protein